MTAPTVVRSQSEFDAAVAAGDQWIRIDSQRGVWIEVATPREIDVEIVGWSSARLSGSSSARLFGSSSARLFGSSSASLSGWSSASLSGSSSASLSGWSSASLSGSSSASLSGWSSASLSGSSSARLSGWSSARLYDSSSASLSGSSSASLYDSSSASLYDSSSASLYDSSSASAGSHCAVHLHSGRAHVQGGVLIDHTAVDLTDRDTWLAYKGIRVVDGQATFYKAVDKDLNAGHSWRLTAYPIRATLTCPDWNPAPVCGGGLHFSPDPHLARRYYNGDGEPRYLEVTVPVDELVLLDDKVKSRSCTVVREVTLTAAPVQAVAR